MAVFLSVNSRLQYIDDVPRQRFDRLVQYRWPAQNDARGQLDHGSIQFNGPYGKDPNSLPKFHQSHHGMAKQHEPIKAKSVYPFCISPRPVCSLPYNA